MSFNYFTNQSRHVAYFKARFAPAIYTDGVLTFDKVYVLPLACVCLLVCGCVNTGRPSLERTKYNYRLFSLFPVRVQIGSGRPFTNWCTLFKFKHRSLSPLGIENMY